MTVDQTIPEETIREEDIPEEDIPEEHNSVDLDITLKDDDTYSMHNANMDPGNTLFFIIENIL